MLPGRQIFTPMRFLLFIALIVSIAVSPAIALASCASMGGDAEMTAAGQQMTMDNMAAGDCDDMGGQPSQTHDAGCAAACALVCPGFYAGPDQAASTAPAFEIAQYSILSTDAGLAAPSHLDPPPPRS